MSIQILAKHKRTIILANIVNILFHCYDEKEKTKLQKILQKKINKGFRKFSRVYGKKAVYKLIYGEESISSNIWNNIITSFNNGDIYIEASSLITYIYEYDRKCFQKHFNISEKKMIEWAKPFDSKSTTLDESRKLTKNSFQVARDLISKVNKTCGIDENNEINKKNTSLLNIIKKIKQGVELGENYQFSYSFIKKVQKEHSLGTNKNKIMVAFGLNKAQYDFIIS